MVALPIAIRNDVADYHHQGHLGGPMNESGGHGQVSGASIAEQ